MQRGYTETAGKVSCPRKAKFHWLPWELCFTGSRVPHCCLSLSPVSSQPGERTLCAQHRALCQLLPLPRLLCSPPAGEAQVEGARVSWPPRRLSDGSCLLERVAPSPVTSERCITLRNDFAAFKGGDDARALHPPDPPAARRCLIPSDDAVRTQRVLPPTFRSPSLRAIAYAGAQNRNAAVPTSVALCCVCGVFLTAHRVLSALKAAQAWQQHLGAE